MFGAYYVFDALSPVTPLLQSQLGFTDAQVGLLDTAYNVAALLTLIAGGVLLAGLGLGTAALAQPAAWPAKPVRIVVTFPPGGAPDTLAVVFGAEVKNVHVHDELEATGG